MKRNWKKCQNSKNSKTSASRLNCREARMLTKWRQVLVENSRFPVHYLLVKTFLSLETDCTRFLLTYLLTYLWVLCLCFHEAVLSQGNFCLYPLPDDPAAPIPPRIIQTLPPSGPVECVVRVYVIRAFDLQPRDPGGSVSP